jgi:hypothetical protein
MENRLSRWPALRIVAGIATHVSGRRVSAAVYSGHRLGNAGHHFCWQRGWVWQKGA